MKIAELQIGDWVEINRQDKPSVKVVIGGIDKYQIYGISGDEDYCGLIEDLRPIPLTKEILEKNGIKWLSSEPSGRTTYCCNGPVINCMYVPGIDWIICAGPTGSIKVPYAEASMVRYVHQLQHLLNLAGIEKKIVI